MKQFGHTMWMVIATTRCINTTKDLEFICEPEMINKIHRHYKLKLRKQVIKKTKNFNATHANILIHYPTNPIPSSYNRMCINMAKILPVTPIKRGVKWKENEGKSSKYKACKLNTL